jgi:predicted nucleotide-binding protein
MARPKNPATTIAPSKTLSGDEIASAIARLNKRIEELRAVDVSEFNDWAPDTLVSLEKSIEQTLERVFGPNTTDFERYKGAAALRYTEYVSFFVIGGDPEPPTPISKVRASISAHISSAIALLSQAVAGLEEDLAHTPKAIPARTVTTRAGGATKVFIVHGHTDAARETVARFIQNMGFEPIILHEQHNGGRTVIEKIEHHGDVGFAVVLLTPDDVGGKGPDDLAPRARQNVILELGYFIGRLGRDRVCALKSGELEVPSDFAGVVYQSLDSGGGWKLPLARELKAAGYSIDWERLAEA